MSKATEEALAELHGEVATALTKVIKADVPAAAHIMAAITFLKNNNVTADASSNAELQGLAKELAERRATAKRRLSPSAMQQVAAELDRDLGGDTFGLVQ